MILQALHRYYQLLLEKEGNNLPREEFSSADVSFEIHLDDKGHVAAIIQYVNEKGKVEKQTYNVPKQTLRPGKGIKPYFLCDKTEYLFGAALSMREECREGMKSLWCDVLKLTTSDAPKVKALYGFINLSEEQLSEQLDLLMDENLKKALLSGGFCVLKYAPTGEFFHDDKYIQKAWEDYYKQSSEEISGDKVQTCLITGEQTPINQIARLHPSIKNVVGAQSSGAAIVSFNIPSFCSYERDQSYNAPTSKKAADAYGYVLNRFLADPKHRVRLNDMTVVFWAESATLSGQDLFSSLFEEVKKEDHTPISEESVRERVRSAVLRIRQGQNFRDTFHDLDADATFYVLGLSPNAARLSVRFWYTGTLGEIGERVWEHYKDLAITGLERSPTIRELLREIAVGHDWSNIPPNMEGQMLRSILIGSPFSRAIFAQLMNRIRSESDDPKKGFYKIGAVRAAMIKAYLLRMARASRNKNLEGEITMALNEQSASVPYHLGRLFAVLEKTQVSALGQGINTTIRDRFWGAASATPANVFPRLLSLSQHHVAKDEEWGRKNDQNIQDVMSALPEKFPKRLTLEEQGMFALGYYHQRQAIYTKKSDK
ncbi:type I-C CRISPR-associated protein Cas8c/Csd1 [Brevibacillus fluminis]|uniref:type I-C CRISPR-associated protein Cas8c/Csd1 n=1 Tax=Brevibacillus fluminis TaxID=511487 RepID=UPI003F8A82ED